MTLLKARDLRSQPTVVVLEFFNPFPGGEAEPSHPPHHI